MADNFVNFTPINNITRNCTSLENSQRFSGPCTSDREVDDIGNDYSGVKSFHCDLIEEVRKYPCLWDHSSNCWRDTLKKREAWKLVAQSLQTQDVTFVEKEFKKLKDNYRKCLKRRESEARSGARAKASATCNFFNELSFMKDVLSSRETQSNINFTTQSPTHSVQECTSPVPSSTPPDAMGETSVAVATVKNACSDKRRRSKSKGEDVDLLLVNALKESSAPTMHTKSPEKDSNELFCASLVDPLRQLPSKKRKLAQIKILQVLYELEDSE